MIKESIGARGKTAEKAVKTVLDRFNGKSSFSYFRLPDTRSAGSYLAASPGDFVFFSKSVGGVLEVKSTEHLFRLAKGAVSQLHVLHKLEMAGAKCLILVLHKVPNKWRILHAADLESGVPSWNLTDFPLFDNAEEALLSTGLF